MDFEKFYELLSHKYSIKSKNWQFLQSKVCVQLFSYGSIGGIPTSKIVDVSEGIDWNGDDFILKPADELRILLPEEIERHKQRVRSCSSLEEYNRVGLLKDIQLDQEIADAELALKRLVRERDSRIAKALRKKGK